MKDQSIELQRKLLGSIDLKDLEEKDQSAEDRKNYCAAIFSVFPRLEKDLKRFMHEQLMFSSIQAATWEQVLFGRGTFNGLDLMLEHWKTAAAEYRAEHRRLLSVPHHER